MLPVILFCAATALTVLGTGITMRQDIALHRQTLDSQRREMRALIVHIEKLDMSLEITRDRVNELNRAVGILEERTRRLHPGEER